LLDQEKNRERDDQKIQNIVEKNSVIERRRAGCLGGRDAGILFARQIYKQIGKIDSAQKQPDGRHQNVLYERRDNFSERCADNHADSQVDDIATHDEFFEFAVHKVFLPAFSLAVGHGASASAYTPRKSLKSMIFWDGVARALPHNG
jgi:hypothetical protein